MNIKQIKIIDLNPAEYNPRTIDDEGLKGLTVSLATFGLVEPIIINKDNTIIGGHQRVKAWKSLGNDSVPCFQVDLDKQQEKKLNVVLNSQAISGKYDHILLLDILEELKLDTDYLELRLDKLESIDLPAQEDFSEKSYEVDVNSLGDESTIKLKYDNQTYLNLLELLSEYKEENDIETNEEILLNLIKYNERF